MRKLLLALGAIITGLSINAMGINTSAKEVVNTTTNKYLNTDVYVDDEGKSNTIYWASGIEAPKMGKEEMLNDPKNPTKEGYFYSISETTADGHARLRYEYPTEVGKGYYDFNKNFAERGTTESPLCYLVSASNILLWWMDQNMEYIEKYMYQLENEDLYGQLFGAVKILPYNASEWSFVHDRPELKAANGFIQTELGLSKFVTNNLRKYYSKGKGSYPDRVFDLFINGYQFEGDIQNGIEPNSMDNFRPDPTGGYFYPIFGNQIISERIDRPKYSYYSDKIKELLANGKGITLTYKPATAGILHSVTLWGAEYDEAGNLTRVYLTDGDDPDNSIRGFDGRMYSRGLFSAEVRQDENGGMYITDIIDKKQLGALVVNLTVLDLAQDIWEDRVNDKSPVSTPVITAISDDQVLPVNGETNLEIDVKAPNKYESVSYQWYSATRDGGVGVKLGGKSSKSFKIPTSEPGTMYYYCEVSINKGGKKSTVKSRYVKVTVDPTIPLVNAQAPIINRFDNGMVTFKQYETPYKLTVKASSPDGGELSYQWYTSPDSYAQNGTPIKGATGPSYVPNTNNLGRTMYYVVVTNTNKNATGRKTATAQPQFSKRVEVVENPNVIDRVDEMTPLSSLAISYNDSSLEPIAVKLRLGARINSRVLKTNKEYGMIVLGSDDLARINSLATLDNTGLNALKKAGFAHAMEAVKVEGTEYSQFSWVIPNISKDKYDYTFNAYIYEVDKLNPDKVIVSKVKAASIRSLVSYYISNSAELGLSENIINVLKKI